MLKQYKKEVVKLVAYLIISVQIYKIVVESNKKNTKIYFLLYIHSNLYNLILKLYKSINKKN